MKKRVKNKIFHMQNGDSVKNKLDSLFFTRLFVSEQKQIALMARHKKHASENLRFSSPLRNKLLRNEDFYEFNCSGR